MREMKHATQSVLCVRLAHLQQTVTPFPDTCSGNFEFSFIYSFHALAQVWLTLREESGLRVFENRMLRRILGPKRDEVTGEWIKLHNDELNDLYCSPNIVRVIKSRRMRWVGHVVHMGQRRGFWWENLKERDHLEDPGVDGRIILRWTIRKLDVRAWTGSKWLRTGTGGGHL